MEQTIENQDTNTREPVQFQIESIEQIFTPNPNFTQAFSIGINRNYLNWSRLEQPSIIVNSNSNSNSNSKQYLINKYTTKAKFELLQCYETCSICWENFFGELVPDDTSKSDLIFDSDDLCQLGCTHCFHTKCIGSWLQNNLSCPICRQETIDINNQETIDINNYDTCRIYNERIRESRNIPSPAYYLISRLNNNFENELNIRSNIEPRTMLESINQSFNLLNDSQNILSNDF